MASEPLWKLCTAALEGAYGASPEPVRASSAGRGSDEHDQYVRRPVFDTRRMVLSTFPPTCGMRLDVASLVGAMGAGYEADSLPGLVCVSSGGACSVAMAARASDAVFTGVVVRVGDTQVSKDMTTSDAANSAVLPVPIGPGPGHGTTLALDAAVMAQIGDQGITRSDSGCIDGGGMRAVNNSTSFAAWPLEVSVTYAPVSTPLSNEGQAQLPPTAKGFSAYTEKNEYVRVTTTIDKLYGKKFSAPKGEQVILYLYAPLAPTVGLGPRTAGTPLHATRALAASGSSAAMCAPPWREERIDLYPGWCSADVGPRARFDSPLPRVVSDCIGTINAERESVTADGGTAHDEGTRAIWSLVYPIARSLYTPQIRRDAAGARPPGGPLTADSVYAQGGGGVFRDFMRMVQSNLGLVEQSGTTPNCKGLMAASTLCDCAMLDQPIGAVSDPERGYGLYPRVAYHRDGRGRLNVDTARCFTVACQTTDADAGGEASVMQPFGRPPCNSRVQECKSFQSRVGNTYAGSDREKTVIRMDCPS